MPVPPLRDLITPTSTANSLPAATVNERLLLTLAMLATGKSPDGGSLPAGGARFQLGPLTTTATGAPTTTAPPVAGYVAWYDATQITGQADNTPLATWLDASGNSHTVTQNGTGGSTYYNTTPGKLVNGKPAVWVDGVASSLASASFGLSQPLTIFVVGGPAGGGTFVVDSSNRIIVGIHSNGNWALYAGGAGYLDGSLAPQNGSVHVEVGVFNSPTSVLYVDGTQQATGDPGSGTLGVLYVGGSTPGLGGGMAGPITEVLIYPSALSPANVTSVSNYLKTKWGTP